MAGTSFLCINAHLAAHPHKNEDRNVAYDRITTELQVRWKEVSKLGPHR